MSEIVETINFSFQNHQDKFEDTRGVIRSRK